MCICGNRQDIPRRKYRESGSIYARYSMIGGGRHSESIKLMNFSGFVGDWYSQGGFDDREQGRGVRIK